MAVENFATPGVIMVSCCLGVLFQFDCRVVVARGSAVS